MEKLMTGGAGPLLVLACIVVVVTVGVMSILLPILVFRILSEVSKMNKNMGAIITALNEAAKASREPQRQHQPDDSRPDPVVSKKSGSQDIGEKSLRFR